MRSSATSYDRREFKDIVSNNNYRGHIYAITISPTEDPESKTSIDCNVVLSNLISSSYDGESYSICHEIKKKTKVVHLHCWIATAKPLSYKTIKRLNPGWQIYAKRILTKEDLIKWNAYCMKQQGPENENRIVEHNLNTTYSFY